MANRKVPQLRVVLDTSSLFTQSASDLLRNDVVQAIRTNSRFGDLNISWHIPEIVRDERRFQMTQKANELLPAVEKMQRIVGIDLNIDQNTIDKKIDEIINKQIGDLNLNIALLDIAATNWKEFIKKAVFRIMPFEKGDKEKGFKDALIMETFLQLVSKSPVTPSVCRLAFVTEDQLLAEAVKEATSTAKNVRVLNGLDELKTYINTLISDVSEDFVERLRDKAKSLFFIAKDEDTLYYKEKIYEYIVENFKNDLAYLPSGATTREDKTWFIGNPRFVRKEGTRIHWITTILIEFEAFIFEEKPQPNENPWLASGLNTGGLSANSLLTFQSNPSASPSAKGAYPGNLFSWFTNRGEKKLKFKGKTVIEISWSSTLNHKQALIGSKIDAYKFVENTFTDV